VRPRSLSFKCSDLAYEMLIAREGVIPAPYMARAKWVQLETLKALPCEEIRARLTQAHRLVAANLTRKARAELGLE
jgi:predicted DNA-binding protein (MmcQ/YjbR family)